MLEHKNVKEMVHSKIAFHFIHMVFTTIYNFCLPHALLIVEHHPLHYRKWILFIADISYMLNYSKPFMKVQKTL